MASSCSVQSWSFFDRLSNRSRTRFIPEQTEDGMAPVSLSKETEVTRPLRQAHGVRRFRPDSARGGFQNTPFEEKPLIQLVNAEAQARFGRNLIERVRSEADKRVCYEIARLDEPKAEADAAIFADMYGSMVSIREELTPSNGMASSRRNVITSVQYAVIRLKTHKCSISAPTTTCA